MDKLKGPYRKFRFPAFMTPVTASEASSSGADGAEFEKGYQEGLEEGREKGFGEGYQEGLIQGRDEGQKQGFDHGFQDGQISGKASFEEAISSLSGVADAFAQVKNQKASDHIDQLCILVEQVAKKVIRAELTLNSDQILKLVSEALDQMDTTKDDSAIVYLSSDDADRLKKQGVSDIQGYAYKADPSLGIGQCRIQTDSQEMNVSTDDRLDNCMDSVKETLSPNDE